MRTTIDVPDPVYRRLKAEAALRGTSMKELVLTALEREMTDPRPPSADQDQPFPVIQAKRPGSLRLEPEQLARVLDAEDAHGLA